ncbi:hypothetical protein [Paraburkholderia sp. GAS334]|uniref:hypothetical protein n=1 Tax=Paraburkholderia sp. GAS334 TaxID=3035131 RepID=UPI003D226D06
MSNTAQVSTTNKQCQSARNPFSFDFEPKYSFPATRTGPEIINFQDAARQARALNGELSVAPTSAHEAPQNEPVTQQSAPSAQSRAEPQRQESTNRKRFDKDEVLKSFDNELTEIFTLGFRLRQEENTHQGKVQTNAIAALAKILGVRRRYFDAATPEAVVALMNELHEKCKTSCGLKQRNSNTTEFHLLSRIFRGSDRKQASADAKILIRAHDEGQTEQTFAAWVAENKNLTNILKGITDQENAEKAKKREESKNDKAKCAERAAAAMRDAMNAGALPYLTGYAIEDLPEFAEKLPMDGASRLVVVHRNSQGLHFYIVDSSDNAGTSNQTTEMPDAGDEEKSDHSRDHNAAVEHANDEKDSCEDAEAAQPEVAS